MEIPGSISHGIPTGSVCGGTVNRTDYNAPKKIVSDEIVSFSSKFFIRDEYNPNRRGAFLFDVKPAEGGRTVLSEQLAYYNVSCETTGAIFAELRKIIEKYNLVQLNGTDEYTSGLSSEFQPCFLSAEYRSGERLYFCTNNNPFAGWSKEIFDLFANEFAAHGDGRFLPPPAEREIARFNLKFTEGNIFYIYGEIKKPAEGVHYSLEQIVEGKTREEDFFTVIEKSSLVRRDKDQSFVSVYNFPDDDYYTGLQKVFEKTGIRSAANFQSAPFGFVSDEAENYYSFYAEYKSGRSIYGFSADKNGYEAFLPVAKEIAQYIESFIAKSPHVKN